MGGSCVFICVPGHEFRRHLKQGLAVDIGYSRKVTDAVVFPRTKKTRYPFVLTLGRFKLTLMKTVLQTLV